MPGDMTRLSLLVNEIDQMVEAAALDAALPDQDVRRLLRFVAQVVQVVEQAFQEVLGVLVELSQLEPADLSRDDRMRELKKNVALLTARSYYRDAAEICSRLKHLGENFDQYVRPAVQHLPQFTGWHGVFGLIEHREGRIIMLVEESARELEDLLTRLDPSSLGQVRAIAFAQGKELKALLSELHELNARILGYSGKPGFLELTANRLELQREIRIMVDKRDQSVTHGHRVTVGAGANVGNVVVATTIQDSFKTIKSSNAESALKSELERLCTLVEEILPRLPTDKHADVGQDLANLVSEATKDQPLRKWYELSAEGLIEAAKAVGAFANPVIATVQKILTLLT